MHELTLMGWVRESIVDLAARERFARVSRVSLEVGVLLNVEPEALRFCFDAVMRGTPAEGASLELESVLARGSCRRCLTIAEVASRLDSCPSCGAQELDVTSGDRLALRELEVE
jgi:hydrogenase nickel incorporation protein HypA/HybF